MLQLQNMINDTPYFKNQLLFYICVIKNIKIKHDFLLITFCAVKKQINENKLQIVLPKLLSIFCYIVRIANWITLMSTLNPSALFYIIAGKEGT